MKCDSVSTNIAVQGPLLARARKSCRGAETCSGSGPLRSRVVANVMTKHATHTTAHSAIVICHPRALSPAPNFATSGRVNPPTMSCASIADTKRYDDNVVRSLLSPVITPLSAEYGVLLAEYSVMRRMFVRHAHTRRPVVPQPGGGEAATITMPH